MVFQAGIVVALLILGYLFGSVAEKRHYKKIIEREAQFAAIPVIASRYPPEDRPYRQHLVTGTTVVASDYFKTFVSGLVNLFGGRVTPFESLLDRARRESILRMKDQASNMGATYVFNVKFETSRITAGRTVAMEVLAYGTAMMPLDVANGSARVAVGLSRTNSEPANAV